MKIAWKILFLSALSFSIASGQVLDLQQMTLDFQNVTSTRLVSNIDELFNNDKDVEFGDFDNDGDVDVVIAVANLDFGQRRNKLYRNDDGVLVEVSGSDVIPEFALMDVSRRALFRDFDADGFLDLVVLNDSNSGTNQPTSPGRTRYYRNVNGQSFVNETERLDGFNGAANGGMAADFNNDGLCDIVMVNLFQIVQDQIVLNDFEGIGAGNFASVTSTNMPVDDEYGTHGEAADMNGDGKIDLLVGNRNSTNSPSISFIRYNDNGPASSGPGDFRFGGPGEFTQFPPVVGNLDDRALVPGDFNNDGRMDFYFANFGQTTPPRSADRIFVNQGNDEFNKAIFQPQSFSEDQNGETLKVDVGDLDQDGRVDLVIMSNENRPYIYRNASENGEVSFIEWTPPVFDETHLGTHANSECLFSGSRKDLFVGAQNGDFVFENKVSSSFELADLVDGQLPDFHDHVPVSIFGNATIGEPVQVNSSLPAGARVSVLLRSAGEASLTVRQDGELIATSDRVGHGTDQAVEFTVTNEGLFEFELNVEALSFDGNGDGVVDLLDIASLIACLNGTSEDCEAFDIDDSGSVNLLIIQPFVNLILNSKTSEAFALEILSRSD